MIRGSGILGTQNQRYNNFLRVKLVLRFTNNFNISSKISFHLRIAILYRVSIIEIARKTVGRPNKNYLKKGKVSSTRRRRRRGL